MEEKVKAYCRTLSNKTAIYTELSLVMELYQVGSGYGNLDYTAVNDDILRVLKKYFSDFFRSIGHPLDKVQEDWLEIVKIAREINSTLSQLQHGPQPVSGPSPGYSEIPLAGGAGGGGGGRDNLRGLYGYEPPPGSFAAGSGGPGFDSSASCRSSPVTFAYAQQGGAAPPKEEKASIHCAYSGKLMREPVIALRYEKAKGGYMQFVGKATCERRELEQYRKKQERQNFFTSPFNSSEFISARLESDEVALGTVQRTLLQNLEEAATFFKTYPEWLTDDPDSDYPGFRKNMGDKWGHDCYIQRFGSEAVAQLKKMAGSVGSTPRAWGRIDS